jgi:uncharacterized protein YdeI (BOF family)
MKLLKTLFLVNIFLNVFLGFNFKVNAQALPPSYEILINEAMPNPVGSDTLYEWIELYNYGNEDLDLANWTLDGLKITSLIIPPNSFAIIAKNSTELKKLYPQLNNIIQINFSLNNSTDSIILKDSAGNVASTFDYTTSLEGKSLERKGPILIQSICQELGYGDNDTIENSNASFSYECWPPLDIIDAENIIKEIVFSTDNINFTNSINLIDETEFYISVNLLEEFTQLEKYIKSLKLFLDDDTEITNPTSLINYINKPIKTEITLSNDQTFIFTSSNINILPLLKINEFKPSTSSAEVEWLEIYNPNDFDVDIEKYYFSNSILPLLSLKDSLDQSGFETTNCLNLTSLEANKYCLLFLPDETLWKSTYPNDSLQNISLKAEDLNIDSIDYSYIDNNKAFAFIDNQWISTSAATPGSENIGEVINKEINLIITELYPTPESSDANGEWIEIYNYGEGILNLTGLFFSEEIEGDKCIGTSSDFFEDVNLEPLTHKVIYQLDLGITLNNSGDLIYLCDKDKNIVDYIEYPEITTAKSFARLLDLVGKYIEEFSITSIVTPEQFNQFEVVEEIEFLTIQAAESLENNSIVYIKGSITVDPELLGKEITYLQDETGGIKVDLPTGFTLSDFLLGRTIGVKGKLSESYQERKIIVSSLEDIFLKDLLDNNFENIEINQKIIDLSNATLESDEGTLVYAEGIIEKNYTSSFDIKDQNGKIIRIAILSSTGIELEEKSKGDLVKVVGILGQYNDTYRIMPRYLVDIIIEKPELPVPPEVVIQPKIPTPSTKPKTSVSSVNSKVSSNSINAKSGLKSNGVENLNNYRMPTFTANTLDYTIENKKNLLPMLLLIIFILIILAVLTFLIVNYKEKGIRLVKYLRNKSHTKQQNDEYISFGSRIREGRSPTDK